MDAVAEAENRQTFKTATDPKPKNRADGKLSCFVWRYQVIDLDESNGFL
ncbi:hypothetical protein [Methylomonas fluvii]|nr:hypothetical protein [Methylomonas fluvii]